MGKSYKEDRYGKYQDKNNKKNKHDANKHRGRQNESDKKFRDKDVDFDSNSY